MNIYQIKETFNKENTEYLMTNNKLFIYEPYKYEQMEIDTDNMILKYKGKSIEIDDDDLSFLLS